jgi:hypothetical protein
VRFLKKAMVAAMVGTVATLGAVSPAHAGLFRIYGIYDYAHQCNNTRNYIVNEGIASTANCQYTSTGKYVLFYTP